MKKITIILALLIISTSSFFIYPQVVVALGPTTREDDVYGNVESVEYELLVIAGEEQRMPRNVVIKQYDVQGNLIELVTGKYFGQKFEPQFHLKKEFDVSGELILQVIGSIKTYYKYINENNLTFVLPFDENWKKKEHDIFYKIEYKENEIIVYTISSEDGVMKTRTYDNDRNIVSVKTIDPFSGAQIIINYGSNRILNILTTYVTNNKIKKQVFVYDDLGSAERIDYYENDILIESRTCISILDSNGNWIERKIVEETDLGEKIIQFEKRKIQYRK